MRHCQRIMMSARTVLPALMLFLALIANKSEGAKVLGIFPFPAPSHQAIGTALAKGLAAKGHDVTVIVPGKTENLPPNYREIVVGFDFNDLAGAPKPKTMFLMDIIPFYAKMLMLWGAGAAVCDLVLNKPNIQEFIHSKDEEFDVIIVEAFFNECFMGFSHTFQAPIVQICPFGGSEWLSASVGGPHNYAYMPDFFTNYNQHMTFFQRVHNTIMGLIGKFGRAIYYIPKQNELMQKGFAGTGPGPLPHLADLESNTSLVLMNQHLSLGYPKPLMPNAIEVGGLQIKPPKKLPKDLQEFLDEAKEGVVYFSMGSNLKSADLPVEKRDALLRAFSKLKMKVLWKWEDDVLPGQPKNVKLGKWFPQSDLLAHPNVKVFITHGGLLSTQESVYHGVPVIGIPIFGDQKMNTNAAVKAGYGYFLNFHLLDEDKLILKAINTVISDSKYRETAQRISRIFRDQPRSPLDTAVFWTEYVIRHKGAAHMRSGALDLTWYQYYLLDVMALLAAVLLLTLCGIKCALKLLCRFVCKKKPAINDSKKTN